MIGISQITIQSNGQRPDLGVTISEAGSGRPTIVLHGGGGPMTVAGLSAALAETSHVLTPVHPGWDGRPRPEWLSSVAALADAYVALLEQRDLRDVLVIGSSIGGWIASEMALRDGGDRISGVVLIDGVGIDVPDEPMVDFFSLSPRGIAEHSFHDASRFFVDPATIPAEQLAVRAANMVTMRAIAGESMADPALAPRLAAIETPTLVLWGESDRVVTPAYGRAYADAFGNGRFELIPEAGHLPQLEQPEATLAAISAFSSVPA